MSCISRDAIKLALRVAPSFATRWRKTIQLPPGDQVVGTASTDAARQQPGMIAIGLQNRQGDRRYLVMSADDGAFRRVVDVG